MPTKFSNENRPVAQFEEEIYRYTWTYQWDRGQPLAGWLMMNPSLASAEVSDLTVDRVMHFSREHGCGGVIVVNLWPLITPKSAKLWKAVPELDRAKIVTNRDAIVRIGAKVDLRVVAFGLQAGRRHPAHVCDMVAAFGPELHCLGASGDGWPYHPLVRGRFWIPNDRRLVRWGVPTSSRQ